MTSAARRLAGLLALVVVLTTAAGCGSSSGTDSEALPSWRPDSSGPPSPSATADPSGGASESEAAGRARFRVASFNVLGASHTGPEGNKRAWRDRPAAPRMRAQLQTLERLGPDFVGLQEFERDQWRVFKRNAEGWRAYPGMRLGPKGLWNSVIWRSDTWRPVERHTVPIPYFAGKRIPMPYVLLEHRDTGARVWFLNVHNPASSRKLGDNKRWLKQAVATERRLVRRLSGDGTPVIVTGDFNDRAGTYCRLTAAGMLHAAGFPDRRQSCDDGTVDDTGMIVDWIFATPGVAFSDYRRIRNREIRRTSDHALVLATANLAGSRLSE